MFSNFKNSDVNNTNLTNTYFYKARCEVGMILIITLIGISGIVLRKSRTCRIAPYTSEQCAIYSILYTAPISMIQTFNSRVYITVTCDRKTYVKVSQISGISSPSLAPSILHPPCSSNSIRCISRRETNGETTQNLPNPGHMHSIDFTGSNRSPLSSAPQGTGYC